MLMYMKLFHLKKFFILLYKMNVNSDALSAYKAVVVIVLVVLSTPVVRKKLSQLWGKIVPKKEVA